MTAYLILSSVLFFLLSFMWSSKTVLDTFIKYVLFLLGGYGAILSLTQFGFGFVGQ